MAQNVSSRIAAAMALLGIMTAPLDAVAEGVKGTQVLRERISDVAMDEHQIVRGQILDVVNKPVPNAEIEAFLGAKRVARMTSDARGEFRWKCSSGGTYHLLTNGQVTTVRIWTAAAAPPQSTNQILLVHGQVVRGQSGTFPYTQVNPWVVAGVVAVAVAIPVVLHNNRTDGRDGS